MTGMMDDRWVNKGEKTSPPVPGSKPEADSPKPWLVFHGGAVQATDDPVAITHPRLREATSREDFTA